ncbi:UNVERIFIED_CONTAM: AP2 domain-containing protein, partial [Kocuria sp. CPCC 205274]
SENNANAQLRKDSTSGVKGVTWASNIGKWRARIQHNGRRITIGYFDSPEIAVAEIKQKRSELHKEFANHG